MRGRRGCRISSEEPGPEVRGGRRLGGGRGALLLPKHLQGGHFRVLGPEHFNILVCFTLVDLQTIFGLRRFSTLVTLECFRGRSCRWGSCRRGSRWHVLIGCRGGGGLESAKVGGGRFEEVWRVVEEGVGGEGGRLGVGRGGGGGGGGGAGGMGGRGGGVLHYQGGPHAPLEGGGGEGDRDTPAPQVPVGVEQGGEGGLVLHGGRVGPSGGSGEGLRAGGVHSTPHILGRFI